MKSLSEPDLLIVILVLSLCEPGQQCRDWLDVLDAGSGLGGVLSIGCHGQYGVQGVVICGAQTAHYVKQLPRKTMRLELLMIQN